MVIHADDVISIKPSILTPQLSFGFELKPSKTFDSFYTGNNAQLIHQLTSLPDTRAEYYYLFGAKGVGKTHLLQACCQLGNHYQLSTMYVSLQEAVNYSAAILENLESIAILCIDDIQAVAGLSDWEEQLFILFNNVRQLGGHLIIAGSDVPNALHFELQDLLSRLNSGLTYQVQTLNDQQLLDAIHSYANKFGLSLLPEVTHFLLKRLPRDMGVFAQILRVLDEASLAHQRKITIPFIKQVLQL